MWEKGNIMRKSVQSPVALLATLALTLALASCSSGDSSSKSSDPESAAVTDEAAQPTTAASTDVNSTDAAAAGDGSTTASTSDVCQLLDNDTITSITGIDFSQAVATDDGAGTCDWDLTSTGGMAIVSVMTLDNVDSSYEVNKGVAESMFDDVTDVSVPGVDHAFAYMGGLVVAMDFGGQYVQVLFMSLGAEETDPSVPVKLAEEVARNW